MARNLTIAALLSLTLAGCIGGDDEVATQSAVSTQQEVPAAMRGVAAKQLFGAKPDAAHMTSAAFGSYSKGCQAGAVQLPETGPTWQAMRLSRNRNWAQPETVDYVQDLSRKVAAIPGWSGLYVGDLSQPRGGPMLTGHASHQIGLDADIWLRAPDRLNLSRAERENISSTSLMRTNGAYTNGNWTPQHMAVLKAAASDPRVARIFLFPGGKVKMCDEATGDRAWLAKIRPWYGHHYHFHVRLKCPSGMRGCVDQAPPPPGDGCDEARQWVRNIVNPPKPDPNAKPAPARPKRDLTLADLPGQCVQVLQSP
ncbi:penicillin-insensitive murein endopeptidase [Pseudooceanicola sp. LIPI14-2-Ac024]|uniref:penicillin-insensitive murein endopeptidase n=1 Tax=Pseudooceanicola sp. LIPI14-2-Ac024 TaxID=3344875 RepID=UPI0035CF8FE5